MQDGDAALRLERPLQRPYDHLARRFDGPLDHLAEAASRDRPLPAVQQARLDQSLANDRHPAGGEHLGRGVGSPRPQVGQDRRAAGHAVELVQRERHAEIMRHREQVQHRVGRAARRHHARNRVLEAAPRHQRARRHAGVDQFDGQPPAGERGFGLARVGRRDAVPAQRRDAQHLAGSGHGVGGELAAARAGAGAGVVFHVLQLRGGEPPGPVSAQRLVNVLDGQRAAGEHPAIAGATPCGNRAAV